MHSNVEFSRRMKSLSLLGVAMVVASGCESKVSRDVTPVTQKSSKTGADVRIAHSTTLSSSLMHSSIEAFPEQSESRPSGDSTRSKTPQTSVPASTTALRDIDHMKPWERVDRIGPSSSLRTSFEKMNTVHWKDHHGTNLFKIVAHKSPKNGMALVIEMTHSIKQSENSWKTIRKFRERLKHCANSSPEFIVHNPTVTDLNANGIGEVTWAYSVGCRNHRNDYKETSVEDEEPNMIDGNDVRGWTQMSSPTKPLTHKVLMTEFGSKYAIRGTTVVIRPSQSLEEICFDNDKPKVHGGRVRVDPKLDEAPKGFRTHATTQWDATVNEPIECKHISPG